MYKAKVPAQPLLDFIQSSAPRDEKAYHLVFKELENRTRVLFYGLLFPTLLFAIFMSYQLDEWGWLTGLLIFSFAPIIASIIWKENQSTRLIAIQGRLHEAIVEESHLESVGNYLANRLTISYEEGHKYLISVLILSENRKLKLNDYPPDFAYKPGDQLSLLSHPEIPEKYVLYTKDGQLHFGKATTVERMESSLFKRRFVLYFLIFAVLGVLFLLPLLLVLTKSAG